MLAAKIARNSAIPSTSRYLARPGAARSRVVVVMASTLADGTIGNQTFGTSRITAERMPGDRGPGLRARRPGAGPVRGLPALGDHGRRAGPAGTATPRLSPAVARCGTARPGSPRPVAAVGVVTAQWMDPRLPQPRPGRARDRHRRPARPGSCDAAGAGSPGGESFTDRASRGRCAKGRLAAAG